MKLTKLDTGEYAIILPPEMLEALCWDEHTVLDLEVRDGSIVVTEVTLPTPEEMGDTSLQEFISNEPPTP